MSQFIENFNYNEYIKGIEHIYQNKKYFDKKINDIAKVQDIFYLLNNNLKDLGSEKKHLESFYSLEDEKKAAEYYRPLDQDLNKNYDLLFSGCSQTNTDYMCPPTYPLGDHNNIWGFQVSKYFNKEALNLAINGYGIYQIIRRIFYQIFKNGNPKIILILFPDYGRLTMPHTENLKTKHSNQNKDFIQHYYLFGENITKSYSKSPYFVEDIFDVTIPLFYNLQSISLLENYCRVNGIYLKYSSWHGATNILFELLKQNTQDYQGYIPIDSNIWLDSSRESPFTDCHLEVKERVKDIFEIAPDNLHMGIHRHCHIAEAFIESIKNDNPWN